MRPLSARDIVQAWEWGQEQHLIDRALLLLTLAQPELSLSQAAALTVGQRNVRLLTLREQTLGPRLHGVATCPLCQTALEFALDVHDIRGPEPAVTRGQVEAAGCTVHFRLPTSADLATIAGLPDAGTARRHLVERCIEAASASGAVVATGDLPDTVMAAVLQAMHELDPEAETRFDLVCAACGHLWSALFDITSFFWAEIQALAQRLLHDVITLARTYGWREVDILAMSNARRTYYLERAVA
jgi:hypothetical protein